MITTFQRKKTEVAAKEPSKFKSKERSTKDGSASSSDRKSKASNLGNYKQDAPKKGAKSSNLRRDNKTDHQIKVEDLESKVQEKKKQHDEYLKKRGNNRQPHEEVADSYLKDPSMLKKKSESHGKLLGDKKDSKKSHHSGLACDLPKSSNNQKVIKSGIKHAESQMVIEKPDKRYIKTSQESRTKSVPDPSQSNTRSRPGNQQSQLSRQAQNAAKKGNDIYKKKTAHNRKEKASKRDIEEVNNLPDYPKQDSSSSDEERNNTMNKPAMQLVAELRAKQDFKMKKHFSAAPPASNKAKELNKLKSTKEGKGSYNPTKDRDSDIGGQLKVGLSSKASDSASSQQRVDDSEFDDLTSNKKSSFASQQQQELTSGDLTDLMAGNKKKVPKQVNIEDDDFDNLLASKPKSDRKMISAPAEPVEVHWKIDQDEEDKEEETFERDDISLNDSVGDVSDAFNFTDTEFDANNRDDFDVDTEILKNNHASLHAIAEVDEESEQTIQRRKCESEIKTIEKRIKEMEAIQKSKWKH